MRVDRKISRPCLHWCRQSWERNCVVLSSRMGGCKSKASQNGMRYCELGKIRDELAGNKLTFANTRINPTYTVASSQLPNLHLTRPGFKSLKHGLYSSFRFIHLRQLLYPPYLGYIVPPVRLPYLGPKSPVVPSSVWKLPSPTSNPCLGFLLCIVEFLFMFSLDLDFSMLEVEFPS